MKFHKGYLDKLASAVEGTPLAQRSLEQIIDGCGDASVFNVAAKVWNHAFYWKSLTPPTQQRIGDELRDAIAGGSL